MTVPVMQPDHHQYSLRFVNIGGNPKNSFFLRKLFKGILTKSGRRLSVYLHGRNSLQSQGKSSVNACVSMVCCDLVNILEMPRQCRLLGVLVSW